MKEVIAIKKIGVVLVFLASMFSLQAQVSWTELNKPEGGVVFGFEKIFDPNSGQDRLFMASDRAGLLERDFVTNEWVAVDGIANDYNVYRVNDIFFSENTGVLYVSVYDRIYYSNDYGDTWNFFSPEFYDINGTLINSGAWINALGEWNDGIDNILISGSYLGLFYSVDGGATWDAFDNNIQQQRDIIDVEVDSVNDILYFVYDQQVYSFDLLDLGFGGTWNSLFASSNTFYFSSSDYLAIEGDSLFIAFQSSLLARHITNGGFRNKTGVNPTCLNFDGPNLLMGSYDGRILQRSSGGETISTLRPATQEAFTVLSVFDAGGTITDYVGDELTVNGDFESGDETGWTSFAAENNGTFTVTTNQAQAGVYSGLIRADVDGAGGLPSSPLIKQANIGIGKVSPGATVTVSFGLYGSLAGAGGVVFAELFSEMAGGGTSKSDLLSGGPLTPTATWTNYSYTTTLGTDVSAGITLQLKADCGGNTGCITEAYFDNVSIVINDNGSTSGELFLGEEGGLGVYSSTDGGINWNPENTGFRSYSHFDSEVVYDTDQLFLSADGSGLFTTSNQGTDWQLINSDFNYQGTLGYDTATNILYYWNKYSTDQGLTFNDLSGLNDPYWAQFFEGVPGGYVFTTDVLNVAGNAHSAISRSSDGVNFSIVQDQFDQEISADKAFHYSPSSGSIFYARTNQNNSSLPAVLRSDDNGDSWVNVTPSVVNFFNFRVNFTEDENGNIYLAGYEGLYKTSDNGATWTNINVGQGSPIPAEYFHEVEYHNGVIYVATCNTQVYTTSNDGATWNLLSDGLNSPNDCITGFDLSANYLWLTTDYGLYNLPLSTLPDPVSPLVNVYVEQIAQNLVQLFWTPDPNATNHELYESTNGGSTFNLVTDTLTTTGYLRLDIANGATKTFRLVAKNAVSTEQTQVSITQRTPATPIVSVDPPIFTMDDSITITYYANRSYPLDVLLGSPRLYMHAGLLASGDENSSNWQNIVGTWSDDSIGIMSIAGTDIWEITLRPRDYFGSTNFPASQIGIVFRNPEGTKVGKAEGDVDIYIDIQQTNRAYNLDGDLIDNEGNGINLISNNTPEYTTNRFGDATSSLLMDGDDELKTDFVPKEGQPFSVSFWMERADEGSYQYLDFGANGPWMFNLQNTFYIYDGSNIAIYDNPQGDTGWDHVTMTWNGSDEIQLYTNGRALGTQGIPGFNFSDTLVFGRTNSGFGADLSGKLDQIIIDSYVISPDTVWSYYHNFNPPTNFSVTPAGDQQISYSYTDIGRPATYHIYRDGVEIATQTAAGSFTDTPVNNGQYYEYTIFSEDDLGNISNVSNPVTGVTFNGLVATYDMSEYNMIDNGPNGFNGSSYSNFQILSTDRFGELSNAYLFRTSRDSIVTSQTFADGSAFSISIWTRWTNDSSTAFQPIVSWSDTTNTVNAYLAVNDLGELSFTDNWTATGVQLPNGDWTHVVATHDGAGNYQLYLDGVLASSFSGSTTLQFGNMYVGSKKKFDTGPNANFFNGQFDDYTLFNRLITASEVDTLYRLNGWPGTQFKLSDVYPDFISSGQTNAVLLALNATSSNGEILNGFSIDISSPLEFENYRLFQSTVEGDIGSEIALFNLSGDTLSVESLGINLTPELIHFTVVADAKVSAGSTLSMRLNKADILITSFPDQLFGVNSLFQSKNVLGVDSDMAVYYPFNGNAFDQSGNNFNGVVTGASLAADRNEEPNQAYLFDTDVDVIKSDLSFSSPTFTFTSWVNPQNTNFSTPLPILNFGSENPWFGIINGQPSLKGFNNADSTINADEWSHLAVTYDSDVTNYYINGQLVSTKAGTLNFSGTGLAIGNSSIVYSESFQSCTDVNSFTAVSLVGDQTWNCSDFGITSKAPSINGFSGSALENDDWLVSPAINLSGLTEAFLSFYSDVRFNGPDLKVLVSTDYAGDVTTATWTELSAVLDTTPDTFDDWTFSGDLDLSAYLGGTIYVAFQYTSTAMVDGAAFWKIDDIIIKGSGNAFPGLLDEIRVYDLALTADQIDYLFERSRNGLIAYYPLDGDAVDLIDGNDGAIFGNPNEYASNRFLEDTTAFEFSSPGDFIVVANSPGLNFDQDFSIGLWFNMNTLSGVRHILRKYSGSGAGFEVNTNALGGIDFILFDDLGNDASLIDAANGYDDGKWHKLLISKNDALINISIDGQLLGERSTPTGLGTVNNIEPLYIAANPEGNANFMGLLDDIKIYDKFIYSSDLDEDFYEGIEGFIFNEEKYISSWNIGTQLNDVPAEMIMDREGNLVFTGYATGGNGNGTFPFGFGSVDLQIVKVSPKTNKVLFARSIGGEGVDYGWKLAESNSGGYLATGYTSSTTGNFVTNGDRDIAVTKVSDIGEVLWTRNFGGIGADNGRGIVEFNDGTIGVAATSRSADGDIPATTSSDIVFFRLSSDGSTILNSHVIGDPAMYEAAWNMIKSQDGNVIISGDKNGVDGWVIKLNPTDGTIIWEQTLGGTDYDDAWDISEDKDGNVIIGGTTRSSDGNIGVTNGGYDAYIAKLESSTGNIIWAQNYGGAGYDSGEGLVAGYDGYYLTGATDSQGGDIDNSVTDNRQEYLLKVDYDGNILFSYSYGSDGDDYGRDMVISPDDRVYSISYTGGPGGDYSFNRGGVDIMINNHYSDQADLYAINFEGQENLPVIDYQNKTVTLSTVLGTDLSNLPTEMESAVYSRLNTNSNSISSGLASQVFEDFDENRHLEYGFITGSIVDAANNPAPDAVNGSALVAQYTRASTELFDVFVMNTNRILKGSAYVTSEKVLKLDVYTDAPVGTEVLLQFETKAARSNPYPTGRHSVYEAYTTIQNGWETLTFTFREQPDFNLNDYAIDQIILLVAPTTNTGNTYYLDNLRSEVVIPFANTSGLDFSGDNTFSLVSENGRNSINWTANITPTLYTGTDILDMDVTGIVGLPIINPDNHSVTATISNSVSLTVLGPIFNLSPGATINPPSGQTRNFTGTVGGTAIQYTVTSESGVSQVWDVRIGNGTSNEANITGITVSDMIGDPVIDEVNGTVALVVQSSADVTNLVPTIDISPGANISPESGVSQNFSSAVAYTITAEDGTTTKEWTVSVTTQQNNEADIIGFSVTGLIESTLQISPQNATIFGAVSTLEDLTSLTPQIDLSFGATISPTPQQGTNFSSPVTYTVTSEDGNVSRDWVIIITQQVNDEADIVSFTFDELAGQPAYDFVNNTVTAEAVFGTDLSALTNVLVEPSVGAQITSGAIPSDFSSPVSVSIQAQDGTTSKNWTITVTEAPNTEADITGFTFDGLLGDAVINPATNTVTATAAIGQDIAALTNVVVNTSVNSTITSGTIPTDFSAPVIVTVQAQDGVTLKNWTITVTQQLRSETEILSFTFTDQTFDPEINTTESTITGQIAFGVGWPNITPSITVSDSATISPADGVVVDFTDPVTYTVTAEDGTTRDWTVTITELDATQADILDFTVDFNSITYRAVINPNTLAVEILLDAAIDFSSIEPVIAISPGATIDKTGPQNFNNPVEYTVSSGDGNTNKTWTAYARPADGSGSVGGSSFGAPNAPATYTKGSGGFTATAPVAEGEFSNVEVYAKNVEDPAFQIFGSADISGNDFTYDFDDADINDIGILYYFKGTYPFAGDPVTDSTEVMATYVEYNEVDENAPEVPYTSAGSNVTNYRIIAFPFQNPDINEFTDSLDATNENQSKWRLARYNGSETSPYDYYGQTNFGLDPGIGYFFISATRPGALTMGGQTVSLTNSSFLMDLSSGWNLIGNPYLRGLNWQEVIQHNIDQGIINSGDVVEGASGLFRYTGSFTPGPGLDAFEGGYIQTTGAISNFEIPTSAMNGTSSGGRVSGALSQSTDLDQDKWMLQFTVASGNGSYGVAAIGLSPNATDEIDPMDLRHLPRFSDYIFVDIEGAARNHKTTEGFKKWDFTIPNNLNTDKITLTWNELLSSTNTVILVDGVNNRIYDLTIESSIDLPNVSNATHSLYFGDKKDIYARLDLNSLALQNLYPNPVTEDLNLEFYSPQNGIISFELLSIDGKVSFVDNVSVSKGLNRLAVEDVGTMLADGLYFLKMEGFDNQAVMIKFVIK